MNDPRHEWDVGLSAWIIQDGNYGDFETGQDAEFALEFFTQSVLPSQAKVRSATGRGAAKYEINGEVVYLDAELLVLDFGIRAFQQAKPRAGLRVGTFVAAEIYLGIDPFCYFERLYKLPGMPPLIYSWIINSISQQTPPFIGDPWPPGQTALAADPKKPSFKGITKTDAWKDDEGNAEYVLNCSCADLPPRFEKATRP
jgi:hypothetical protein